MFLIIQKVLKKYLKVSRVNYLHIMLHMKKGVSVLLSFSSFTTDSDVTNIFSRLSFFSLTLVI